MGGMWVLFANLVCTIVQLPPLLIVQDSGVCVTRIVNQLTLLPNPLKMVVLRVQLTMGMWVLFANLVCTIVQLPPLIGLWARLVPARSHVIMEPRFVQWLAQPELM